MKWFKWQADLNSDPQINALYSVGGPMAIGCYILILGEIAKSMSKDRVDTCHVDKTMAFWCELLKMKPSRVQEFGAILSELGLAECQVIARLSLGYGQLTKSNPKPYGQLVRFSCRKLLILKDEYTRKSGHTPDSSPDSVRTIDIDRDGDKGLEDTSSVQSLGKSSEVSQVFEFWQSQPHLIHCRKLNGHQSAINSAVEYAGGGSKGVEIVNLCISRYSTLLANHHGVYRSVYRWNITEFLSRRSHYNIDRLSGDDWEKPFVQWQKPEDKNKSDLLVGMNYD